MTNRIALRNKARKRLDRFRPGVQKLIWIAIDALKEDPATARPGLDTKLLEGQLGLRRVRVGDYRLLYFIDRDAGFVYVTEVMRRTSGTDD